MSCIWPTSGRGLVCCPCAQIKKKCAFPKTGTPAKKGSSRPKTVSGNIANIALPAKKASGGKRKAKEVSPELFDSPSPFPSPIPTSFDPRPFKKPSSSSLVSFTDNPTASFGIPLPSHISSSYGCSFIDSDSALLLENQQLPQQLTASREDLAHKRNRRDADRVLFEQQIEMLKADRERWAGWKGKEHE